MQSTLTGSFKAKKVIQLKFIWTNLATNDLERTTQFYTVLGFVSNGKMDEGTSFFFGGKTNLLSIFSLNKD